MSDFFISNENSPYFKSPHHTAAVGENLIENLNENLIQLKLTALAKKSNLESLVQDPCPSKISDSEDLNNFKSVLSNTDSKLEEQKLKESIASNSLPCSNATLPLPSPQDLVESSMEYKMAVQERLNVRLQEQLHTWVQAQIELHLRISKQETHEKIILNQKNVYEEIFQGEIFPGIIKYGSNLNIKDENYDVNNNGNIDGIVDSVNKKDGKEMDIKDQIKVINSHDNYDNNSNDININNNNEIKNSYYNNNNIIKRYSNNCSNDNNDDEYINDDISYLSQNKNDVDLELDSTNHSFHVSRNLFNKINDRNKNIPQTKNFLSLPSIDSSMEQNNFSEEISIQSYVSQKENFEKNKNFSCKILNYENYKNNNNYDKKNNDDNNDDNNNINKHDSVCIDIDNNLTNINMSEGIYINNDNNNNEYYSNCSILSDDTDDNIFVGIQRADKILFNNSLLIENNVKDNNLSILTNKTDNNFTTDNNNLDINSIKKQIKIIESEKDNILSPLQRRLLSDTNKKININTNMNTINTNISTNTNINNQTSINTNVCNKKSDIDDKNNTINNLNRNFDINSNQKNMSNNGTCGWKKISDVTYESNNSTDCNPKISSQDGDNKIKKSVECSADKKNALRLESTTVQSSLQKKIEIKENRSDRMEQKLNFRVLTEAEYYAEKNENENAHVKTKELPTPGKIFSKLLETKKLSPEEKKIPDKVQSSSKFELNYSVKKPINAGEYSDYDYTTTEEYSSQNVKREHSVRSCHEEYSMQNNHIENHKQCSKESSSLGIMKDYSLMNSDAYLNVPMGRRSLSRERGANTETQHKSSLLQERLKFVNLF